MEEKPKEKTPEEKARLKEERRARKKARKLDARATKRGISVEALLKDDAIRKLKEADIIPPPSRRVKRSRADDEEKNKCTVYVGNLVYRAGETEIRRLFAPLRIPDSAIVEIDLPKDKVTGKFYGVAFVQFDTPENAEKACLRNNFKLLGRPVTVQMKSAANKKAKSTESASSSSKSDFSAKSDSNASENKEGADKAKDDRIPNDGTAVFVAALADSATDEEIMTYFSKSGRVISLRRIYDKVTKDFTGAAFIQFADATAAKRSISFNRQIFHNRPLRVEMAKQKTMK